MTKPDVKLSRRQFLGKVGIGATALGAGSVLLQTEKTVDAKTTGAKKYAMVIDTNRCTCCHGCTIACLAENNVPDGNHRTWVKKISKGRYPDISFHFLPRLCNHCEDAPCLNLCPTGATYRTKEDGVVHINREVCIGCKICIDACPYGSRFFNPITQTADKCDFCYHRISEGIEPACVATCTGRARIFGDLNDPDSEIVKYLNTHSTHTLRADLETGPKIHYVGTDKDILGADYSALK